MAISDSFNLSNALNSQSYAYKCWYNYYYGSNSMGITSNDMGQITQTWSSELPNWRATATDDENAYEIEDDDYSTAVNNGKNAAQEATGFDGEADKNTGANVTNWTAGIAGMAAGASGSVMGILSKITSLSSKVNASTTAFISAGVGAVLVTSAGILKAADPNREAAKACETLTNEELPNAQASLSMAQDDMNTARDEVTALSDEANGYTEDANEQNEEDKALFDLYKASYDALIAKVEAGETLTEEEKSLLNKLVPLMQELGVNIEETSDDTTSTVGDIYGEMESYQANYDNAAATIGEVQGVTDFAAGFDEATEKNAKKVGQSSKIGQIGGYSVAASGATAIATAGWNIPQIIAGGVAVGTGAAAGILFGKISKDQNQYEAMAQTEIDVRVETQDFNTDTSSVYDESITDYEGNMDIVNDMEILVPDDMEVPEETPAAATGGQASTAGPGLGVSASNTQNANGTTGNTASGASGNTTGAGSGFGVSGSNTQNTSGTNGNTASGVSGNTTGAGSGLGISGSNNEDDNDKTKKPEEDEK